MSYTPIRKTKLLVIFPCYNEEEILRASYDKFIVFFELLIDEDLIHPESKICFVDDGSTDSTWQIIEEVKNAQIHALKLTNNFGHQKALLAGLETFRDKFDAYVTLDVDLQDDYQIIVKMLEKINGGYDIVYGARNDRSNDSFFKRKTADWFYKFMLYLGVKTVPHHADFRLLNNKALKNFLEFSETHLFLRAIFPYIGLNHTVIHYKRNKRESGKSKYPLSKMMSFAWDGVTSFSVKPLRFILLMGVLSTILAILLMGWFTLQYLMGNTISGWFSIIAIIIFFGGIQTFAIGIIGEYVGKIFMQVKNRPRYIIEKKIEAEVRSEKLISLLQFSDSKW